MSRGDVLTPEWRALRDVEGLNDANIADAPRVANPAGRRTRRAAIMTLVDGRAAYVRHEPGAGTVVVIAANIAAAERAARRDGERDPLGLDPGDGDGDPLPARANRPASIPAGGRR